MKTLENTVKNSKAGSIPVSPKLKQKNSNPKKVSFVMKPVNVRIISDSYTSSDTILKKCSELKKLNARLTINRECGS